MITLLTPKGLNPLYFGSLVPTARRRAGAGTRCVLIPFISGLWFLPVEARKEIARLMS